MRPHETNGHVLPTKNLPIYESVSAMPVKLDPLARGRRVVRHDFSLYSSEGNENIGQHNALKS